MSPYFHYQEDALATENLRENYTRIKDNYLYTDFQLSIQFFDTKG